MTDYKTILVHVDAGKTASQTLEVALQIGAQFEARVAALHALSTVPAPTYAYEGAQVVHEAQRQARAAMRTAARRAYDESVRRTGYENVEWRESPADALEAFAVQARYADLVVVGQRNPEDASGVDEGFARGLPLAAGRPVLVVPYAFERRPVGRHVLVAWNASREAARAVSDALPILRRASHVHVVSVSPVTSAAAHGEEPGADIALYLTRHGIKVTASRLDAPDIDAGGLLLSRTFDLSADLIVMGAWGHSRAREYILGGATRTIFESMTVPVLMAH